MVVWELVLLVCLNDYCMLLSAGGGDDCIAVGNDADSGIDAFPSLRDATKPAIDAIGTMHASGWARGGARVEWEGGHGGCSERQKPASLVRR